MGGDQLVILRDYQEDAVQALFDYFERSDGNPLIEAPTGSGKSLIIAEFVRRAIWMWPSTQVIMLTHVKELVEQNHDKLVAMWGEGVPPIGIYSAGLKRRDYSDQILFAGVQSAYRCPKDFGRRDLILIDEAHRVPKSGAGMYRTYIDAALEMNPNARVVGFTATPYRLDGGYLHAGKDRLFTDIAYTVGVERLINQGYLSKVVAKEPDGQIDTGEVHSRGGDFAAGELEQAAMGSNVEAAVAEIVRIGEAKALKSWLIFACGVEHASMIAALLQERGIDARTIFGTTDADTRAETIADFRAGSLRCIVNVGVLTTGFDSPGVDLLALMRPTQSTSLYVQMVGRGTRIAEGKSQCVVLDFGENVRRHGPINRVKPANQKVGGEAPMKVCPSCEELVLAGVRTCPDCGFEFPFEDREAKHEGEAGTLAVVEFGPSEEPEPEWVAVTSVNFARHEKADKPPSMVVTYLCGYVAHREWVCFEHEGYARKKAEQWWTASGGDEPFPEFVDDAIHRVRNLLKPSRIAVKVDGKWTRICDRDFDPPLAEENDWADYEVPF